MKKSTLIIATFLMLIVFVSNAQAYLPYHYHYEHDSWQVSLKVVFDERAQLATSGHNLGLIEIRVATGERDFYFRPEISEKQVNSNDNELEIEFDFIDPLIGNYELIIPVGSLQFSNFQQVRDYQINIKNYKLNPGFKSTFLNDNPLINEIFGSGYEHNAPTEIEIIVPPQYFTQITTIHRLKDDPGENNIKVSLTDVEVEAHLDVASVRLEVSIDGDQVLIERKETSSGRFAFGLANLTAGEEGETLNLIAFCELGEKLEKREIKVILPEQGGAQDYIDHDQYAGARYTLQEFMSNPQLLESALNGNALKNLNRIALDFPNRYYYAAINSESYFEYAHQEEKITMMRLLRDMHFESDYIMINREEDFQLLGEDNEIASSIYLGPNSDSDRKIALYDLIINGDLIIDLGNGEFETDDSLTVTGDIFHISFDPIEMFAGDILENDLLEDAGSVQDVNHDEVAGEFAWLDEGLAVSESGNYKWSFTVADGELAKTIYGYIYVEVDMAR